MAKKQPSAEERKLMYSALYTKISKATAEVFFNGKRTQSVFNGTIAELFDSVEVSANTITRFLWVMTHKTTALPTILFKINKTKTGIEVTRVHSGFYNNNGEHVFGLDLIPHIMSAVAEYKPSHSYTRKPAVPTEVVTPKPTITALSIDWATLTDDELANIMLNGQNEIKRREELREKQAKLQDVLELMGMNKEQLQTLLNS